MDDLRSAHTHKQWFVGEKEKGQLRMPFCSMHVCINIHSLSLGFHKGRLWKGRFYKGRFWKGRFYKGRFWKGKITL